MSGLFLLLVLGSVIGGGVSWLVRLDHRWRRALNALEQQHGGGQTDGAPLHPPSLWVERESTTLSVSLELGPNADRRYWACTRISVEGQGIPVELEISARSRRLSVPMRQTTRLEVPDIDERLVLRGPRALALSCLGPEARAPIMAAVARGAVLDAGRWTLERRQPIVDVAELGGLARLVLAAADAVDHPTTTIDSRLADTIAADPDPVMRLKCLESLLMRPGGHRRRAVEHALADPSPTVRLRAAVSAGPSGRAVLIALATDNRMADPIRVEAIEALGAHDGLDVRARLDELLGPGPVAVRVAVMETMARIGHAPRSALLRFIRHPESRLRAAAARALRGLGPEAESPLIGLLQDSASTVVHATVRSLRAVGTAAAVPHLRRITEGLLVDGRLKALTEQTVAAITARTPRAEVGQLSLAGDDDPEAGQLELISGDGGLELGAEPGRAPSGQPDRLTEAHEP